MSVNEELQAERDRLGITPVDVTGCDPTHVGPPKIDDVEQAGREMRKLRHDLDALDEITAMFDAEIGRLMERRAWMVAPIENRIEAREHRLKQYHLAVNAGLDEDDPKFKRTVPTAHGKITSKAGATSVALADTAVDTVFAVADWVPEIKRTLTATRVKELINRGALREANNGQIVVGVDVELPDTEMLIIDGQVVDAATAEVLPGVALLPGVTVTTGDRSYTVKPAETGDNQ